MIERARKVDPVDILLAGAVLCFIVPFLPNVITGLAILAASTVTAIAAKVAIGS